MMSLRSRKSCEFPRGLTTAFQGFRNRVMMIASRRTGMSQMMTTYPIHTITAIIAG